MKGFRIQWFELSVLVFLWILGLGIPADIAIPRLVLIWLRLPVFWRWCGFPVRVLGLGCRVSLVVFPRIRPHIFFSTMHAINHSSSKAKSKIQVHH